MSVVALGMSFGANAGYAINPARDLGPRLLAWAAGWGIPIVGPFLGGVVGAFVYDLGIRDILHARGETAPPEVEERGRTGEEHG
ncbi:MAG TPA: aquaporin [Solirubrobacteraceae bacterium]|jgi:glycerol uptake facilitator protein|nr:aquaporin [Solirubrobacteraceae bacterium]